MKEVQDIEWLDEKIILLREFLPEGGKWKFDLTKQQVEPLDEETKRLLAAKSVEASEREQLIQRLGGQDPDWWFAK